MRPLYERIIMELNSNETSETPRFTKKQIVTIAVRIAVVGAAIGTIALISYKTKNQNDES